MSIDEKAKLVVGMGLIMPNAPTTTSMYGNTIDIVPGCAGATFGLERLGITRLAMADGPAGVRINPTRPNDPNTYYCTGFPVGILLSSTWDAEVIQRVGESMGNEVKEYGLDLLLAPGMNIQRNPLCGRNFEYYSEDPYLSGMTGAAMVRGVQSQGVGTSLKHLAANNAETNRNSLHTFVSVRALREIYLENFRIAVQEGKPWTVMSAYNLINGTYASESRDLLTDILRDDWGFQGFVMTDWMAGKDVVAQMNAGNDLLMPGNTKQTKAIIEAAQNGKLDVKQLDQNVTRILQIILSSPRFKGYQHSNKPDLVAHATVARQSAAEGMVLLKNEDALPLVRESPKVAVFGSTSYEMIAGGMGSGHVNKAYTVDLIEGLRQAGYTPNEKLKTLYGSYLGAATEGIPPVKGLMAMMGYKIRVAEMPVNADLARSMAVGSDVAIITIGRTSSEGLDISSGEGAFQLSAAERDLITFVTTAFHAKNKKVVVVLNIGSPIETASWKALPDAILLAWQGGQEAGNSVADILSGKVNPSGKLPCTFPLKYADVPGSSKFPGSGKVATGMLGAMVTRNAAEIFYEEGIYVGYRYYETFKVQSSYEFGFGLSFTTFDYGNLQLSSPTFEGNTTVTVDIQNTGKHAGKEVVQLYLSAPTHRLDKPVIELKRFAKTRLLQPGETQTLTFTLDARSLASFDTAASTWIADRGGYTVKMGASSKDIRQQATFTLGRDINVKRESVALVPQVKIQELTP